MGKLRLPGASESQGLSRTRTQDPDLEKALGSSCRYLDGCPASLRGWDTEAWAWWGGPSGTPSPCPPPRSSPRGEFFKLKNSRIKIKPLDTSAYPVKVLQLNWYTYAPRIAAFPQLKFVSVNVWA